MLEKDIENLIAAHPEEFFPDSGFKLIGQQAKLNKYFADILFTDKFNRMIIIEIKRGILSRDAAGQIMEYYGLLKQEQPGKIIELILCANIIPHERRTFLESAGIDCKELGISFVQEIAKKYNYSFLDEEKEKKISFEESQQPLKINPSIIGHNTWIFQTNPNRYDILGALSDRKVEKWTWEVNQHKKEIKKGDISLIWMSGKEAGIYAIAEVITNPLEMLGFPEEEIYWVDEEDKGKQKVRVLINIKQNLGNHPILKDELNNISELKEMEIFKKRQGTNFSVTEEQWKIISALIEKKFT